LSKQQREIKAIILKQTFKSAKTAEAENLLLYLYANEKLTMNMQQANKTIKASALLNYLDHPIIILSPDCKILDLNQSALKLYRWKKHSVLGENYLSLCKKSNLPCAITKSNNKSALTETSFESKKQIKKIVFWRLLALPKNLKLHNLILIGEDLTALRKEQANSSLLGTMLAQLPSNIYWLDKDFNYIACTEETAKRIGLPKKQIVGKNLKDVAHKLNVPKNYTKKLINKYVPIIKKRINAVSFEELPFKTATGDVMIYQSTVSAIKNQQNEVIGIVGVSADITTHKKLEEDLRKAKEKAEKANISKSNFLATMSHELRTPLNAILGVEQMFYDKDKLSDAQKGQLNIVGNACVHLLNLINDVLDFSKLEAGKLEFINEKFSLPQLINNTISTVKHLTENKKLTLAVSYDKNAPDNIIADPNRVRQLLINLINNAIKFTKQGEIKITVKPAAKKEMIKISVQDTGIGIAPDKQQKIFERFEQVDANKYNRKFGGTGLGLAICKQLVEAMGGEIDVKSKLGVGSTFWFTLPLNLKPDKASAKKTPIALAEQEDDKTSVKTARILLVEDNPMNYVVMAMMLKRLKCPYDLVHTGKNAIKKFTQNKYDIVLLDLGLPDLNGIEVAEKILLLEKGKKHTPIIGLTAHALPEDVNNCLNAGMNEVLTKPVFFPALKALLRKWVK
jgi:PAS domain S-box-containing protein